MSTITTDIDLALARLRQGDVVAIPTETVYGLAGNAENDLAIRNIFTLKNRPLDHPLIMHVSEGCDISKWVSFIPDYAQILMDKFWPGPLTLIMRCNPKTVSPSITGGQDTVALRCPKHPITQALLKALHAPLVAPSANPFGKISPTTAQHVRDSFKEPNLLILDGGRCAIGIESTILTAIDATNYQILRHGIIDENAIETIIPNIKKTSGHTIKAPGKLARHYQPEKPLYWFMSGDEIDQFCQNSEKSVYVMSFSSLNISSPHVYYKLPASSNQAAFELYYQLRCADKSLACSIAIELPPDEETWQGIREKIFKAGQPYSAPHCL